MQSRSVASIAMRRGGLTEAEKPLVVDLAVKTMEELLRMAQADQHLWMPIDSVNKELLNYKEYTLQFPRGIGFTRPHTGLKTEATRETGPVMSNAVSLVETLMDSCEWMEMFPCMVSRALTVDVLSTDVNGNRHGALQLMYAELQILSPLVPTREIYFLRYCKQHGGYLGDGGGIRRWYPRQPTTVSDALPSSTFRNAHTRQILDGYTGAHGI